jgi:hypothetical protein
MPAPWNHVEVEAIVADYFAMLQLELKHEKYSKTAHRRGVAKLLQGRPDGSIERKHQNISAILIELGYPYISGYKPLSNYQQLLREVVVDRIASDYSTNLVVAQSAIAPAKVPSVKDILARIEAPPTPVGLQYKKKVSSLTNLIYRPPVNYLEREARNISLGRAGEEFAVNFEKARLINAGKHSLADQVEHISVTLGDGAGYDVRSYEADGRDRLIEVKTTSYGKQTPFFVSRNEVSVSNQLAKNYHLYRCFEFKDDPRFYVLKGSLNDVCLLDPVSFSARVKA